MAEDLGKRLLAEVEVLGLDEVLQSVREDVTSEREREREHFGVPQLDRLIIAAAETLPTTAAGKYDFPIVEISSVAPGGGKTHLIYSLCAIAVLPTDFGGRQACAIVFDTDGTFSVSRLAAQLRLLMKTHDDSLLDATVHEQVGTALKHVHLFRAQSLDSTIATLEALPAYLLNNNRHYSFDRAVGLIAIDSASAFYWQDRAETEDAAFKASTSADKRLAPPSAYRRLAASLRTTCQALNCPAVVTTWHVGYMPAPDAQDRLPRSFRPSLPPPWQSITALRLLVQRVPIRLFPPGISVTEALVEADNRLKAVAEGKFECIVNEWGLDGMVLGRVREAGGGFGFRITEEGVLIGEPS